MAVNELWLVRHGESIGNVAATRSEIEGLEVIPLDELGSRLGLGFLARELARELPVAIRDAAG